MYTSGEFILHRDDTPFANRQKLLFDELLTAERDCNRNRAVETPADVEIERNVVVPRQSVIMPRRPKAEMKKFRGKESIFKRPNRPAPRAAVKSIADHHRNPHKWVKYSLGDVSNEDMTDQSNTQAALSFLKELRARRLHEQESTADDEMDMDEASSSDSNKLKFKQRTAKTKSQIQFRKPETHTDVESTVTVDQNDKPTFRSSKVVMPEYVIGQKPNRKAKKEKQTTNKVSRTKALRLDHLDENDGEADEES